MTVIKVRLRPKCDCDQNVTVIKGAIANKGATATMIVIVNATLIVTVTATKTMVAIVTEQ